MVKKSIFFLFLVALSFCLKGQDSYTKERLEQSKRHSRVTLHQEKQLTGKIVKLLYDDGYEYLNGFILQTSSKKAFKVDVYYYLGEALYPYLKRNEQVKVKVSGDKDLLQGMLYKSKEDRRNEKSLNLKLSGLGHFNQIISSAGTLNRRDVDRTAFEKEKQYEIVKDAGIRAYIRGKRNRIQLLLDNGDTINTYESDLAKQHYLDGQVNYIRYFAPSRGIHMKSQHTFHMAAPYIFGPLIPTRHDFTTTSLGQRSSFLHKAVDLSFLKLEKPSRGMVFYVHWLTPGDDTLRITVNNDFQQHLDDFLGSQGKEKVSLYYTEHKPSQNFYLFGLEKGDDLISLNEPVFPHRSQSKRLVYFPDEGNKEETEPFTLSGTIKNYLTTNNGTYAGLRLENQSGNSQVLRFLGTHGEDILGRFEIGDEVVITAQNISAKDFINLRFQNAKFNFESFVNAPGYTTHSLYGPRTWFTMLHEEGDKNQKRHAGFFGTGAPYISSIADINGTLDLDINTENQPPVNLPSTLSVDVEIAKINKKKQNVALYMKNGDTLSAKSDKGFKKGERISYLQKFPLVLKGQVNENPVYAQTPLTTIFAKEKTLNNALTPIYDDWMRLMGYEGFIEGQPGRVRISTDLGKSVNAFMKQGGKQTFTLFCNELSLSKNEPAYYFFLGLKNTEGQLLYDNQVRQPQFFKADTAFTSKVKEVVQHTDLYTYSKTTVILENDFVFSISNKTLGSIGASSLVGSDIKVTGKPLVPREGEVLKDESYRLIKPSLITAGNVEFKISD